MIRPDITDLLVHFIRGDTLDDSFATLQLILRERRLLGGTGFIKDRHRCVCFSEAPLPYLGRAISHGYVPSTRYQPFGVLVHKNWLFEQGGRPVIYQADAEYGALPEQLRWRHVRYEPLGDDPVDFTWEREWRIPTRELPINPGVAHAVVPSREYLEVMHAEHEAEQHYRQRQHELILDQLLAWQLREEFPWHVHVLAPDGSASE